MAKRADRGRRRTDHETLKSQYQRLFAVRIGFLYYGLSSLKKEVQMENIEEKYQEALQAIAYLHNELLSVKHCQCEDETAEEDDEA